MTLLLTASSLLYVAAFVIVLRSLKPGEHSLQNATSYGNFRGLNGIQKAWLTLLALTAVIGHGIVLGNASVMQQTINLALGHVVSLVCLFTVLAYLVGSLRREISTLGILVLPVGLAGLLIGAFLSGPDLLLDSPPRSLAVHLGVSLLTFATLCIATAQAAVLYIQEQQLHNRNTGGVLPALPPLQTMETNLLQLLKLGVLLLSINLITGTTTNYQINGRLIEFNHHILLSLIAWFAYCALLVGHKVKGWRGKIAARWTILAFAVLILAYFGTRFVSSIILA